MRVLITGARGRIGQRLVPHLEGAHELRLLSRRPVEGDPRWCQADITEIDQVLPVCEGVDAVVHLAIATGHEGDYEADGFNASRFDINVKGTYNVFEAAARAKVPRVVYASSLTAVWGYPAPQWVAGDALARPVDTYGLTKYLGEEIARHYVRMHSMSAVCLRIPAPVDVADPAARQRELLPQWMAFPDMVEAFGLALTAPFEGLQIVTVVGESSKRRWGVSRAEQVLGWKPRTRLEDEGYTLRDEPADYAPAGSVHGDDA